jgi:3-isopropylmalate/(R)-2-methylmalate dehydratase small subunit
VVSTSFADIFRNNALKNGLLPVSVDFDTQEKIFNDVEQNPELELAIDLPSQTITLPDGISVSFPIDTFSKTCLLEGVDQLGYLLKRESLIEQYEQVNEL